MARIRSTKLQNMRDKSWYTITNKADGPAQVHIYDEIGYVGVSANQFAGDIADIQGDLEIHLNSPGGEVFDGIAIYNTLKPRNPTIIVDSLAASIASVIAMAAAPGKLIMAKNSQMMIHDGFGMTVGNAADMREMADLLDKTSDNIASIYAERTNLPVSQWRDAMKTETWFSAEEAVQAGLADQVQGTPVKNSFDLSIFTNATPAQEQADGEDQETAPWDPDGNGDDDSTPEGDTDHSHWAPDGTQLKPVPGKPMTKQQQREAAAKQSMLMHPSVAASGVDNSEWDASKAWHNGTVSDDPAAFYAAICAGTKTGDKSTQAAWALPYKYSPSSAPNAAGVKNALARINQTEGLTNKQEAQDKLQGLMKKINPDYEPSDDLAELVQVLRNSLKGGN